VLQLAMEQGEGANVLGARCRAGVRELRGQARSRYTGTWCPLWARWAARWHSTDKVGAWSTVTFGRNQLRELVPRVELSLAAK
jgi:hypothetical protein